MFARRQQLMFLTASSSASLLLLAFILCSSSWKNVEFVWSNADEYSSESEFRTVISHVFFVDEMMTVLPEHELPEEDYDEECPEEEATISMDGSTTPSELLEVAEDEFSGSGVSTLF